MINAYEPEVDLVDVKDFPLSKRELSALSLLTPDELQKKIAAEVRWKIHFFLECALLAFGTYEYYNNPQQNNALSFSILCATVFIAFELLRAASFSSTDAVIAFHKLRKLHRIDPILFDAITSRFENHSLLALHLNTITE